MTTDETRAPHPGRRDMPEWSSALTAAAVGGGWFGGGASQRGFQARPVVGGVFALLLKPATSTVPWFRIQHKNSGKVPAVAGMSLAGTAEVTRWTDNGSADHCRRFI